MTIARVETRPKQATAAHHMELRRTAIQFLVMLEDELVMMGVIAETDRACLTREERRRRARERAGEPD